MAKITVIIPNYNGIKYLKECLTSLFMQDDDTPQYEVLIVDNASADGSIEQAENLFPQVRVIRLQENTGFCHAVNVGIQASKAPYVLLLNNDTKVKTGFIKSLYNAIERDEKIFSVSAKMLMWDRPDLVDGAGDQYNVLGWAYARGKGKPASQYTQSKEVFSACGGAVLYRRSILDKIGLFDELHFAYLEDLDLGYRARIHGYRNVYEPKAQVLHYGSASTGSRYNEFKTKLSSANNVYVVYKNMPILQLLWNVPFLLAGFFVKWLFFIKKGMGRIYLKGLGTGIRRAVSKEGRSHKVRFSLGNLGNYFVIQWQLYVNLFKFLTSN